MKACSLIKTLNKRKLVRLASTSDAHRQTEPFKDLIGSLQGNKVEREEPNPSGALVNLIEATTRILEDPGWQAPGTEDLQDRLDERAALGRLDLNSPEGFKALCTYALDLHHDARKTAHHAYKMFASAQFVYEKKPGLAIECLCLGAISLARAVALLGQKEKVKGGDNKSTKDLKQIAKIQALALWKERHGGLHPKLRTNEQFATEVMRRWPILHSSKVICGWCTDWTKEAKKKPFPVR